MDAVIENGQQIFSLPPSPSLLSSYCVAFGIEFIKFIKFIKENEEKKEQMHEVCTQPRKNGGEKSTYEQSEAGSIRRVQCLSLVWASHRCTDARIRAEKVIHHLSSGQHSCDITGPPSQYFVRIGPPTVRSMMLDMSDFLRHRTMHSVSVFI